MRVSKKCGAPTYTPTCSIALLTLGALKKVPLSFGNSQIISLEHLNPDSSSKVQSWLQHEALGFRAYGPQTLNPKCPKSLNPKCPKCRAGNSQSGSFTAASAVGDLETNMAIDEEFEEASGV